MSTIRWQGDRLFQKVGNNVAELGYVALDNDSRTYVLWLKDTCGLLGLSYIRGDEFSSMGEAKAKAATSPSAFIMHFIWMRSFSKRQITEALEEHWEEISSKLEDGITKDKLRDTVSKLPR